MTTKGYYPEVIVAAVDIIGMKNLLKRRDKLDSATKIIGQICGNIDKNKNEKWHWRQFGDSAYLLGKPGSPPEEQVRRISLGVSHLTALGIFGENLIGYNFLLRSGIAKGDLSSAKWNGTEEPFFIGNSMRYAFELERSQKWFGGCIKNDIDCSKISDAYIIEYDKIPINNKEYKGYAINWLKAAKQNIKELKINMDLNPENICKQIEKISEEIGYSDKKEEGEIKTKINNTKKFVRHCL